MGGIGVKGIWYTGPLPHFMFWKRFQALCYHSRPRIRDSSGVIQKGKIVAEITNETVKYVAGLAQLTLDEATEARLVGELSDILGYIEQLNELDTEGVEPMMHVLDVSNVMRDDMVVTEMDRDTALMNAPATDGEYFLVPRILDSSE